MNYETMTNIGCIETLRRLDAYIDDRLPKNEMAAISTHIESCAACHGELDLRRRLKDRLRSVVTGSPVSPFLETRVLASVRAAEKAGKWSVWGRQIAIVASALAICFVIAGISWQLGHLRFTAEAQESYIAKISLQVSNLMRVGLGDHVHCSVFGHVPKVLPRAEEVPNQLPPEYRELLTVTLPHIPPGYRLYTAHQCRYHKRQFVHLSMKNGSRLVSLIITRKQPGEAFDAREVISGLATTDLPMYTGSVQRFEIVAFQTRDHLAYVVSDLPRGGSAKIMLALAPAVQTFLRSMEG